MRKVIFVYTMLVLLMPLIFFYQLYNATFKHRKPLRVFFLTKYTIRTIIKDKL